jgi:hypothetical protein
MEEKERLTIEATERKNIKKSQLVASSNYPFIFEIHVNLERIITRYKLAGKQIGINLLSELDKIAIETSSNVTYHTTIREYTTYLESLDNYFIQGLLCKGLNSDYTSENKSKHDFIIIMRTVLHNTRMEDEEKNAVPSITNTGIITGMLVGSFNYIYKQNDRLQSRLRSTANSTYMSLLYIELLCAATCIQRVGTPLINIMKYMAIELSKNKTLEAYLKKENGGDNPYTGKGITLFSVPNKDTLGFYKSKQFIPLHIEKSEILEFNEQNVKLASTNKIDIDDALYLLYWSIPDIINEQVVRPIKPIFHVHNGIPSHGMVSIDNKLLSGLKKINEDLPTYGKKRRSKKRKHGRSSQRKSIKRI